MPNFPRYNSQARVSTQIDTRPTEVMREGSADILNIATKGLQQVSDITMKWSQAMDTIQYTTAKANYEMGIIDIENRALQDPDYNGSDKYFKELEKLKINNLKGFQSKAVEQKAALEFDLSNQISRIKIENIFNKKIIEVGQDSALKLINLEKSNYINAIDDKQRMAIAIDMKKIIDEQVASGIWDNSTGDKIYTETIAEARKTIKDNEDIRQKQENEIALAQDFVKNQREGELVDLRINGQLTAEIINSEKDINPEFKQAILNSMKSVKVKNPTALDSIIKYNELVERNAAMLRKEKSWLNMGKVPFEEITRFRADVFNAIANGYITDKQMMDLLSETSKTFYRDPVFQNALNQLAAQSKFYATPEVQARIKSEMYGSLIQKVIAGKNPQEAVIEVIKERLNTEMSEITKKDEFGFEIGQVVKGYKYIGNNQWQKQ